MPRAFSPATLDEAAQHNLPAVLRPQKNNADDECGLDAERLRAALDHG